MASSALTVLALVLIAIAQAAVTGDLKGVIILHRHGARSPINPNPKTKDTWSGLSYGLGELTKSGRAMHNAFGTLIRNTYVPGFLPNTISYADTYVRSSDVDRTLQSVQAIFQNLYPGATFPIHTIDVDYELLLQPTDKCASYHADAAVVRKQWDTAAGQSFTANELAAIRQASGWGNDVADSQVISWVVDNLECEQAQAMTSPQSLLDIRERMEAFQKDLSFAQFAPASDTDPRGVIAATLIQTISQNLQDVKSGKWPKFTVYSAHDTTIIGLMTSLGILPKRAVQWLPFFATSLTFELRTDNTNNWYVNAFVGKPNATGQNVETEAGWLYYRQPLGLNCPTPNEQCSLTDFAAYITKAVGKNQGCCLQSPGFFASKCDAYGSDFKSLAQNCQIYRRLCPLSSCGAGQTLQSDTLNCLGSSSQPDKDSWKTVGGIFIATSILLLLAILGFCWRRQVIPTPDDHGGDYTKVPNV